jgi:hypothetical protein
MDEGVVGPFPEIAPPVPDSIRFDGPGRPVCRLNSPGKVEGRTGLDVGGSTMRLPHVRFTIGRLMIAVLALSLTLWVVIFCLQVSRERRAESAYKQAVQARKVAEYAIKEYVEGDFKQEKATIEGQIALAKSDLERAIDRVEWSDKARKLGHVSAARNIADHLSRDRSTFELEQNQTRLAVLLKYTREKTIKELDSEVQKARVAEKVRREQYERERARRKRMLGL